MMHPQFFFCRSLKKVPFDHLFFLSDGFSQLSFCFLRQKPKHALPPTTSSSVISSASIPSQQSSKSTPGYNRNHWLVQEADLRMQIQQASASSASTSAPVVNPQKKCPSQVASSGNHENHDAIYENFNQATPPVSQKTAPPNVLSVSGRKKCSSCGDELGMFLPLLFSFTLFNHHHNNPHQHLMIFCPFIIIRFVFNIFHNHDGDNHSLWCLLLSSSWR